jgi:phenylalanyl-tRNA synthetase beta chain
MAGIMGGEASGITLATTEVFLESAFFRAGGDCRACAALWLRFRRVASFRARRRFRRHAARARTCDAAGDRYLRRPGRAGQRGAASLPARQPVRLRPARVAKVLGLPLTAERIGELFTRLALPFRAMARTSSSRRRATASTSRSRKT